MRDLPADDGPPGSLCLRMWTVTKRPGTFPDRLLCITADARRHMRGSISPSAAARCGASRRARSPARATARWSRGSRRRRSAGPARAVRGRGDATRGARGRVRRHGAERAGGRHADAAFDADRHKERRRERRNSPHSPRVLFPVMPRSPLIALLATAGALAVPATAAAEVIEVGAVPPASPASCPSRPCLAVSRTTGYQAKVGASRGVMDDPQGRRIVAWTIGLGNPGAQQTTFFNQRLGGESQAQITIIDPRRKLRSRVVAQGEPQKLQPYFGSTAAVPADDVDPRPQGRGRRAHRADVGARAGRRPGRGHVVARESRARQVRRHLRPDGAAGRQPARPVLLPVPDGAADLHGDADPGPGQAARRSSRPGASVPRAGARVLLAELVEAAVPARSAAAVSAVPPRARSAGAARPPSARSRRCGRLRLRGRLGLAGAADVVVPPPVAGAVVVPVVSVPVVSVPVEVVGVVEVVPVVPPARRRRRRGP
jgi:hypothetical protein